MNGRALTFGISGQTVRNGVEDLYKELEQNFENKIKNRKGCLALDGWTNPTTSEKHICMLLSPLHVTQPGYLFCKFENCHVMLPQHKIVLNNFIKFMVNNLDRHGFTVIGIVGDNARGQQLWLKLVRIFRTLRNLDVQYT